MAVDRTPRIFVLLIDQALHAEERRIQVQVQYKVQVERAAVADMCCAEVRASLCVWQQDTVMIANRRCVCM